MHLYVDHGSSVGRSYIDPSTCHRRGLFSDKAIVSTPYTHAGVTHAPVHVIIDYNAMRCKYYTESFYCANFLRKLKVSGGQNNNKHLVISNSVRYIQAFNGWIEALNDYGEEAELIKDAR